ncbi:MAG: TlpA disulfide reductase family protein [Specibacter sp.]
MSRRSLLAASGAVLAVALAACTAKDPLAQQANAGDNKNYIAGDGSVSEFGVSSRSKPVEFSGTLLDGKAISADANRGKVTVVNFWYAVCPPCRKEAADLEALYAKYKSKGVTFLGVNVRDEKAAAESFNRTFGITYPTLMDKDGGVQLDFTRYVNVSAAPTTLVLDKQGRVSSRIMGEADKSTLEALITTALAEK